MNSHEVFIHIHQGCFAGTGAIFRLPQCQWSKPDGYGKISQCITTTKHSKAKTVCIFLGVYCNCAVLCSMAQIVLLITTIPLPAGACQFSRATCEMIFWPPYILTPGSIYRAIFWCRGQYIATIFWPPSRYFDPPPSNTWNNCVGYVQLFNGVLLYLHNSYELWEDKSRAGLPK